MLKFNEFLTDSVMCNFIRKKIWTVLKKVAEVDFAHFTVIIQKSENLNYRNYPLMW